MVKPSKLPKITTAMVLKWLKTAQAPQPWDLTHLPSIVRNLNELRQETPYREEQIAKRMPIQRAQKAIDELRRALTSFTNSDTFKMEEQFWLNPNNNTASDFQERTAAVRIMLASLVNIDGSEPLQDVWIERARDAYQFFRAVASPPNTISRRLGNPAQLFVKLALRAMGVTLTVGDAHLARILLTYCTAADKHERTHRPVPLRKNHE